MTNAQTPAERRDAVLRMVAEHGQAGAARILGLSRQRVHQIVHRRPASRPQITRPDVDGVLWVLR